MWKISVSPIRALLNNSSLKSSEDGTIEVFLFSVIHLVGAKPKNTNAKAVNADKNNYVELKYIIIMQYCMPIVTCTDWSKARKNLCYH